MNSLFIGLVRAVKFSFIIIIIHHPVTLTEVEPTREDTENQLLKAALRVTLLRIP